MARLPIPGKDEGVWGNVLNDYLAASHKEDGTLKDNIVSSIHIAPGAITNVTVADNSVQGTKIQDGSVTEAKLDAALQTKVNSSGGGDPIVGGDLNGTASSAQINAAAVGPAELASNAVTTAKIADNAVTDAKLAGSISQSKISNLVSDLTAKANDSTVVHDTGAETIGGVKTFSSTPIVPDGSFTIGKTSGLQAALDAKAGTAHSHDGSDISSGTINATYLGAGTPNATNYLRGDGTWSAVAATDPVVGGDLSGTASNAQVIAGAITTSKIADSNVTTSKIANSNITTAKIADGNITASKLASSSVSTTKLDTIGAPSNGQLLSYNGVDLAWINPSGVPTTLDDLSDVATAGATDGQSLVYQSGTWQPATVTGGGGVTDHGALTGLADDDHPQYHNDARADARYYTQSQVDTSLAGKVDSSDPRLSDNRTPTDNSVTATKLQNDAVTEPKLAVSNAPSNGQLLSWNGTAMAWANAPTGDPTVGGDLSGTASNAQIVANAITSNELAANAVTTAKIANSSVTDDKIATGIAQSKITNLTVDLAGKASAGHVHSTANITSGTFTLDRMPAGYRHTVYENAGSYTRGTTRTDIHVVFVGPTDPGAAAFDGDSWDQTES